MHIRHTQIKKIKIYPPLSHGDGSLGSFLSHKNRPYGTIFNIISNKLDIIGIDIEIIIILLPISILLAIAASPESLQTLTANSDKKAIPVIFIKSAINCVFIENLS